MRKKESEEFEKIPHAGGKAILRRDGSVIYEGMSSHAWAAFQLQVSLNGVIWGFLTPMARDRIPLFTIPVMVISDVEGYWGRKCPACEQYCRVNGIERLMYCPYCRVRDHVVNFTTDDQYDYIQAFTKRVHDYYTEGGEAVDEVIDLDEMIRGLNLRKDSFVYSEERQQKRVECGPCKVCYDILGLYGCCPICGRPNTFDVLAQRLDGFKVRVENPRFGEEHREQREAEWVDILKDCYSEYESFSNDLRKRLLTIPMTPKRRKELEDINFQRLSVASDKLKEMVGVDQLAKLAEDDKAFLNKCVQRRHLFAHRGGVVDQEYLDKANDTSVRLGQKVHVRSKDVRRLIEIIRTLGRTLFEGYCSIA